MHSLSTDIISGIAIVLADLTSIDPFVGADFSPIVWCLSLRHNELLAEALRIIANVSVNSENCQKIMKLYQFSQLISKADFSADCKDNSGFGFALLSAISNFTFFDGNWCPPELVEGLLRALVSQNPPVIAEALRVICNLTIIEDCKLISTDIPDLLVVLLGSVNGTIAGLAIWALVNMIRDVRVKRVFEKRRGLEKVKMILQRDEIYEDVFEGICKLLLNYGVISENWKKELRTLYDEFQMEMGPDAPDHFKDLFAMLSE
jgi:hypothetical protein